ncbi:hypothetical protein PJI74_29520, partial [Mycobacterium kansasii]
AAAPAPAPEAPAAEEAPAESAPSAPETAAPAATAPSAGSDRTVTTEGESKAKGFGIAAGAKRPGGRK